MSVHPILLDRRHSFRSRSEPADSVLGVPVGGGRLLARLAAAIGAVTDVRLAVLPSFTPTPEYEACLKAALPNVEVIDSARTLRQRLRGLDPAEEILFIDPSFHPVEGFDQALLERLTAGDRGLARHLVAMESTPGQTKEFVQADEDGRVQKIQRYYHPQTWPFATGVVCSVVPVACLTTVPGSSLSSLAELRAALMMAAVPSRDLPLAGGALDLTTDDGVLHLVDRHIRALPAASRRAPREGAPPGLDSRDAQTVASSARLVGPVVMEPGVVVEAGALVVGPTLLCSGSRIGANAVVAQCVVMPGVAVPAGSVMRQRVVNRAAAERVDEDTYGSPRALGSHSRGMVALNEPAAPSGIYPLVKRGIELVVASAAMLALSPLMLGIAAAVRLLSPGPIFFGHEREGKDGRPFRCWKFRTMRVGADAIQRELAAQQQLDGPQFKMDRDPRVTPIGKLLRATNLDEIPQLWNVVCGDMSFVGPRPSPFRENQVCVPWRQGRLSVRPGITGLWQVCRHDRAAGDFHQWIEYDLLYVRNMSALVDLRIMLATVLTLGGKRAVPLRAILPALATRPDDVHDDSVHPIGTLTLSSTPRAEPRRGIGRTAASAIAICSLAVASQRATAQQGASFVAPDATWSSAIGSQLRWDRNPTFLAGNDTADYAGAVRGDLARIWAGPRGRVSLGAEGAIVRHQLMTRLDRTSYDARADASRALSRRATGRVGLRARSELVRDVAVQSVALPLATLATLHGQEATAALAWRLAPRATLDLSGEATHVAYDVPLLAPGTSAGGRIAIVRQVEHSLAVSTGFAMQHSLTAGQVLDQQEIYGGIARRIGERIEARATAGAARLVLSDPRSGTSTRAAPTGALDLLAHDGADAIAFRYQHSASQVLGEGGLFLTDYGALRMTHSFGRSLHGEVGGAWSRGRNVSTTTPDRRATDALAGLRWAGARGVAVSLDAFHTFRSDVTSARDYGAALTLGYAWTGTFLPAPLSPEAR